jgi:hypothetical protein
MARKVAEVEERMLDVGDRLWTIAPKIHFERPLPKYPTCAAWIKAVEDVATAYESVAALRKLLDEKAAELGPPPKCPHVQAVGAGQNGAADVLTAFDRDSSP